MVQDLATQWIRYHPCKTKTSQYKAKSLRKFLEPSEKPKVTFADNSLEFCKSCEDYHRETNGNAERVLRNVKEGTSAVLLQPGLDDNGGLILWNAIAICAMSKTSRQTGEHFVKCDSENHLKTQ